MFRERIFEYGARGGDEHLFCFSFLFCLFCITLHIEHFVYGTGSLMFCFSYSYHLFLSGFDLGLVSFSFHMSAISYTYHIPKQNT